jgi:hypothetical protein
VGSFQNGLKRLRKRAYFVGMIVLSDVSLERVATNAHHHVSAPVGMLVLSDVSLEQLITYTVEERVEVGMLVLSDVSLERVVTNAHHHFSGHHRTPPDKKNRKNSSFWCPVVSGKTITREPLKN